MKGHLITFAIALLAIYVANHVDAVGNLVKKS